MRRVRRPALYLGRQVRLGHRLASFLGPRDDRVGTDVDHSSACGAWRSTAPPAPGTSATSSRTGPRRTASATASTPPRSTSSRMTSTGTARPRTTSSEAHDDLPLHLALPLCSRCSRAPATRTRRAPPADDFLDPQPTEQRAAPAEGHAAAYFAGGCFWCMEGPLRRSPASSRSGAAMQGEHRVPDLPPRRERRDRLRRGRPRRVRPRDRHLRRAPRDLLEDARPHGRRGPVRGPRPALPPGHLGAERRGARRRGVIQTSARGERRLRRRSDRRPDRGLRLLLVRRGVPPGLLPEEPRPL